MKSPLVHEFSTSYGANLFDGRGFAEASYIFRKTTSMIEDFQDTTTGTTNVVVAGVSAGTFTNIVYQEHRQARPSSVPGAGVPVAATGSGTTSASTATTPCSSRTTATTKAKGRTRRATRRPSAISRKRSPRTRYYPDGRLQNFQRNRLRMWSIYNIGHGRGGRSGGFRVCGAWKARGRTAWRSGTRASTATQRAILRRAGYPDGPATAHIFFGDERGTERFPGYGLLDLSVNYNIPVFRIAAALDQVRHVQRARQPEADRVGTPRSARMTPARTAWGWRRVQAGIAISARPLATRYQREHHRHQLVPARVTRASGRRPAAARSGWRWASGSN